MKEGIELTRHPKLRKGTRSFRKGVRNRTARVSGARGLRDLIELYEGINGFNASTLGLTEYKTTNGEVTEAGIKTLSEKFSHYGPLGKFPADQQTFFDLGSGIGRVVLGMAILHPEIQARGIEIVPDRVRFSQQALGRLYTRQIIDRIHNSHGNILDPAVNLKQACWIFISNLCFDGPTQEKLAQKLETECQPGCIVICSREMPFPQLSHFEKIEQVCQVQMSWSNTSTCIIYIRKWYPY
jgi:hypothetical protein